MSTINISDLPPRVRDAFMLAGPAILEWDVKSHEVLEDSIQNNKRVLIDISKAKVVEEILCGVIIAALLDLLPIVFIYLAKGDASSFAVKGRFVCMLFMLIASTFVAIHRKKKIARLKKQGAEWRYKMNTLIELTSALSTEERKQLFSIMFAIGMDVKQGKQNAAMINFAYDEGWWDGFTIGGNE